jgi:hypothetical protein
LPQLENGFLFQDTYKTEYQIIVKYSFDQISATTEITEIYRTISMIWVWGGPKNNWKPGQTTFLIKA